MKKLFFWGILLAIVGSLQNPVFAQEEENDSIPLDPSVRYGKLANGFTYYLKEMKDQEGVRFDLIVKAGMDHEDYDQKEYAHLLEHLGGKETKNFPSIRQHFYQAGWNSHAYTTPQSTHYYLSTSQKDRMTLKDGLQVLLDWSQGNQWKKESIAVERGAIEGEMRTTNPYLNWKKRTMEELILENIGYDPHNLQISLENMRNFDSEAFYRYYRDWYRPDLEAAIIVGDINVDSLEKVVKDKFGGLKGPSDPPNAKKYIDRQSVHFNGGVRFISVKDSIQSGIQLEVMRVRPNIEEELRTKGDYRKMMLQQLYTFILQQRSKDIMQQYDPPFSHFRANYSSGNLAGGQINATEMSLKLQNDTEKIKDQFQGAVKTWKQLHQGINRNELEKAKKKVLDDYGFSKRLTLKEISSKLTNHFVDGKATPNKKTEEKLVKDALDKIDLVELQKFAEKSGSLNRDTFFIFFTSNKKTLPPYEVFEKWLVEVNNMNVEPFEFSAVPIESLEDVVNIPIPLLIQDIDVSENIIGVSTVKLSNGVKILLKPTEASSAFLENRISIQAFRPNSIPLDKPQDYIAAKLAPEVMLFTGAGPYSKFDLQRFINEKRINFYLDIDKDNQLIAGDSYVNDLPELINLIYLYLTRPRRDEKAFELWKEVKKNQLEGKNIRGSAQFMINEIEQVWYPQLPRLDEQDLRKITYEDVLNALEKWFSSIEGYTFVVTGDFEKEEVLPVLLKKLSAFPIKNSESMTSSFNFPLNKMKRKLEIKNIDVAYVELFFPVQVKKDLKTEIELRVLNRALNERIHDRLRAGSYAPISQGAWMDNKKSIFSFRIIFDSALGEEQQMIKWALEEFRRLRDNGVDEEWLKNALLQETFNYEKNFNLFNYNDFWKYYLQSKVQSGDDIEKEVLSYGTISEHFINLEDINKAAKKYLIEDNFQEFIGVPEGHPDL